MNKNLLALILIVVAGGLYFTITKGMLADSKAVKALNNEIQTALDNAQKIIKEREEVNDRYNDISQEDKDKIDQMIPSSVDNIRLIIDLSDMANQHGFSLENIKASTPAVNQVAQTRNAQNLSIANTSGPLTGQQNLNVGEPQLDKVMVTFSATASFDEFRDFMRDVERNVRIMEFTKLTVAAGETANADYEYTVELQTYWLRQ